MVNTSQRGSIFKTVGLIAFGIGIGALVTIVLYPSSDLPREDNATARTSVDDVPDAATVNSDRNPSYEELMQRVAELEEQLGALESELQASRASSSIDVDTESRARRRNLPVVGPRYGQFVEQLVAGGFSQERAEWIKSQYDELGAKLVAMSSPDSLASNLDHNLRQEIGDIEYERYRKAIGRHTAIDVWDVAENSPAALAGLQSGDEIVFYDGNRVFDAREIAAFTSQGRAGEVVFVDILRDGQPMQIVLQRGLLDATLYSGGRAVQLNSQ